MPLHHTGSESSASVDVIVHWLADMHASVARLEAWRCLAPGQRSAWLEDEGYSDPELKRSFVALSAPGEVDAVLLSAIERFLFHGDAIDEVLRPALASLLLDRLRQVESVAGGAQSGVGCSGTAFLGPHLLADYTTAKAASARASKLIQEARQTQLGRFIEDVGGIDDKAAAHLTNQIDTEALDLRAAVDTKSAPLIAFKDSERKAYDTKKQHFITQREDKAVTAESNLIASAKASKVDGHDPASQAFRTDQAVDQADHHNGTSFLNSKEQAVVDDDKAYFKAHDLSTLQAGLDTSPTYTVSGTGSSRSVSLSYDWDGTRGSVELDKATAAAELDPALGALNRLTARALWSARQSAAITSWEGQQWPQWQARLAQSHPKLSSQLAQTLHTQFPKAKLPTSFHQLAKQGQTGASAVRRSLKIRERRAERHGVTLVSLQRHRDGKHLRQKPSFQTLSGPLEGLVHAEPALSAGVRSQLQAMALAVLVADVDKQLSTSSQAEALRSQGEVFTSSHTTLLQSLRADRATTTTTLSVSNRQLDISWTLGEGVSFSRSAKDPTAGSAADPTLTLDAVSRNDAQDSLRLSAAYGPDGQLSTSYLRSQDDGTVVRQFGNSYTLSSRWQQRLNGFQAFGAGELFAYEQSLQSAARSDASTELQQHSGLQSHARLDAFGQRVAKNAKTIHQVLHDVRVDRRIEAQIKPHYGSLRAQKLLMNQLQADRASYLQAAGTLRRIQNVKSLLRQDLRSSITDWQKGVNVDQKDFADARAIYATKPYSVEKKSSGQGYQLVRTGPRKDYWQTLTEKQRYAIFNPIYHSEAIFYQSERSAFLAGAGEYTTLRRDGASKKMARLGASATYFNTLLREDKVLYKKGLATGKLAYAPFIVRRQKHLAKRVVHLNRHSLAWRLRLSWKVKRARFLHKHVAAYEQYMLNHKFTGFHPFHRIANKTLNLIKSTWHYVLHPIVHFADRNFLAIVSIFSPSAASWVANAGSTLFKGVKFLSYHLVKALWRLPEHLYHHSVYFGKQLLFTITHPWEYRRIWGGIKKDFRGIYKLGKTVAELLLWLDSAFYRAIFQLGRWMTGNGASWSAIAKGAFHKKLWHKAKLIHDAWQFAGLAALVGKTAATRDAIKIEMLRMQLRRDLHHDGFLASPWRHFVHQHKSFVGSQFNDIKPTQTAAWVAAYHHKRAALRADQKSFVKDYGRYKVSATYRAAVQAKLASDKARSASFTSKLKPRVKASLHTLTHDILKETSNVTHKSRKIKIWTLRQYDLDIGQIFTAYKAYESLGKRGRKEVLLGIAAFKDFNRTHKSGVIKTTLDAFNANAKARKKQWKTYFKTGTSASSYAYAVDQDWLHMGQYIAGQLLNSLRNSIHSLSAGKQVSKDITSAKLGESVFDDIMGGFWLNHYLRLFVAKDASLVAVMQADRRGAAARMRAIEVVVSQPPVHKLLAFWLKRNTNSAIAKDVRATKLFARTLDKRIHQWERIERIGHFEVDDRDLVGLQSLHKNQMLGASLAGVVARTSRWQDLSLQQQAQDRASYDAWLSYNQTTYHGLDKSYASFKRDDPGEYKEWELEKAQIASGESLTVGALLQSVMVNDDYANHTKAKGQWVATPKPPLANFNQHLQAAAANLASLAQDPRLLVVSVAIHATSHAATPVTPHDPSLFAYIMQIRHWSHKIHKKFGGDKAKKDAKAAEDKEAAAKKEAADAKQEVKADEAASKQQVETAKLQLKDGSEDQQQIVKEAEQADATSVEDIAAHKDVDRIGRELAKGDSGDPEALVQQLESGDVKVSEQELEQAELHEERRLAQQWREILDQDARVSDLDDILRAERDMQRGDFKKEVDDQISGLVDENAKLLRKDFREEVSTLEADGIEDMEQAVTTSSELLDKAKTDLETDTEIADEDLVESEEEVEIAIELMG